MDFHAAWCPPCKALAPTIDALADEYAGRATFAKVDVDARAANEAFQNQEPSP